MNFPTDYDSILQRIERINPVKYAQTRNFTDGDVTYLSPYISRGVISLPQVAAQALKNHHPFQIQKFLQELAWREYWQRVWQQVDDKIFTDLKHPQQQVTHHNMVKAVDNAATGIHIIDKYIEELYSTGYMHNHIRMYVSSIVCNIAGAHWLTPSRWMYYHLLDGDIASNSLSWQWVAGAFSSKKYYCNQENIDRYTHSEQRGTFLDLSYESLANQPVPAILETQSGSKLLTALPETSPPVIKEGLPVLIYNAYNLDPIWHRHEKANRVLLLEKSHYSKHPVSDKVLSFIMDLSNNMEGIQVYSGEFNELKAWCGNNEIIFKQHPAFSHYKGTAEKYDELFPAVKGLHNSFFAYWKQCEKYLKSL